MQRDTIASATASTSNAIQWAASLSVWSKLDSGVHAATTQQTNSDPLWRELDTYVTGKVH